jgi:hypothetical protein
MAQQLGLDSEDSAFFIGINKVIACQYDNKGSKIKAKYKL